MLIGVLLPSHEGDGQARINGTLAVVVGEVFLEEGMRTGGGGVEKEWRDQRRKDEDEQESRGRRRGQPSSDKSDGPSRERIKKRGRREDEEGRG